MSQTLVLIGVICGGSLLVPAGQGTMQLAALGEEHAVVGSLLDEAVGKGVRLLLLQDQPGLQELLHLAG